MKIDYNKMIDYIFLKVEVIKVDIDKLIVEVK